MEDFIKFDNVYFSYDDLTNFVLNGVNFSVRSGEKIAIVGANGSGKSTISKLINSVLVPNRGLIFVDGMNTRDDDAVLMIRKTAAMVFQNPDNQIVSSIVEDDVAFGPENLGIEPERIRELVPDENFLIGAKVSMFEGQPGGQGHAGPDSPLVDLDESYKLIKGLEERGCSFFIESLGSPSITWELMSPNKNNAFDVYMHMTMADKMKKALNFGLEWKKMDKEEEEFYVL